MSAAPLHAAAQAQERMEPLRRPIAQAIIASLQLPRASRGLDVGCGIGLQAVLLAQAIGPQGHVVGLDASGPLLETARALVGQAGLAGRVSFWQGSWGQIPCEAETFDWVWSMDAAGYASDAPAETILELVRVIKPGGKLILGYWSSQCLLPGYPALEARLNATLAGIAPYRMAAPPDAHFSNALGWLHEVGLVHMPAQTFVRTVSAPLDPGLRDALADLFAVRWQAAEEDASPQDWREYLRLCRSESPDLILNSPAYVAFFTYSVFPGIA